MHEGNNMRNHQKKEHRGIKTNARKQNARRRRQKNEHKGINRVLDARGHQESKHEGIKMQMHKGIDSK